MHNASDSIWYQFRSECIMCIYVCGFCMCLLYVLGYDCHGTQSFYLGKKSKQDWSYAHLFLILYRNSCVLVRNSNRPEGLARHSKLKIWKIVQNYGRICTDCRIAPPKTLIFSFFTLYIHISKSFPVLVQCSGQTDVHHFLQKKYGQKGNCSSQDLCWNEYKNSECLGYLKKFTYIYAMYI